MPGGAAASKRTVRAEETLEAAARRMAEGGLSCLVALDAGTPRGVVTDGDVVLAALCDGLDPAAPVAALAWRPLVSVAKGERADEAFLLMEAHGLRHLPVAGEAGRIVGMVAIEDALALLLHDLTQLARCARTGPTLPLRGRVLRAEDTRTALPALEGAAPVRALAAKMRACGTEALLVLEGSRPAGIVTGRDLLSLVSGRSDAERTRARDVVRRPFVSVAPGDPLEEVVDCMTRHGVEQVAVVEERRTLGVVSLQGLLAGLAFELAEVLERAASWGRQTSGAPRLVH
jgi:CBS domain-containing protein